MIEIKPVKIKKIDIRAPGSKSYTHRALIAAALSGGASEIKNCLRSEDIDHTKSCLRQFVVTVIISKIVPLFPA